MQYIGFYKLVHGSDAIRLGMIVKIQGPAKEMGGTIGHIKIEIGSGIPLNTKD